MPSSKPVWSVNYTITNWIAGKSYIELLPYPAPFFGLDVDSRESKQANGGGGEA